MTINAKDRLIVALDFPFDPSDRDRLMRPEDVDALVDELDDLVDIVKVGWPLFLAGGREVVERVRRRRKKVFLDLKFGDIAETVSRLIAVAVELGVSFTTINGALQTVEAAVRARGGADLRILTVTLLTSLDASDLEQLGFTGGVDEYVKKRAIGARGVGGDGIIASGREAAMIRSLIPDRGFAIVTPGIRPSGSGHDDHKRAATPEAAIAAGADYLVVGRPIVKARSPRAAAQAILEEMQRAFDARQP